MIFHNKLKKWYLANKRDLPWRETNDPYKIWLSEIILQQTRINYGIPYYNKFIHSYPSIEKLAYDELENILKLWQGLGYYQRAKNMHITAKTIMTKYNGIFPRSYDELKELNGIGEYTAAAIASFSFKYPVPVIDGNVSRFISRLFGVYEPINHATGKSDIKTLAYQIFDKKNPDIFNQAIMEFGALQCIPKNPECFHCIFNNECIAFKNGHINILPFKKKTLKIKSRYFYYFLLLCNGYLYFHKRTEKDIWEGLYDFPLIEFSKPISKKELFSSHEFQSLINKKEKPVSVSKQYKHQLSHQTIFAVFYCFHPEYCDPLKLKNYKKIRISELHKLPVPGLIEKYLRKEFLTKNF